VNATVIDGLGGVVERGSVVVEGRQIVDVLDGGWSGRATT
jgi:hypothetical protein